MEISNAFGVIEPQHLYTYDAITRRLGISRKTIRAAIRNGLKVSRAHRRAFILGQDWIDYIVGQGQTSDDSSLESQNA
jgi:predicted transcriptional regulator